GKTLMATMAAYTLALNGKGVHIVTVNDYLAKRDAKEMGVLYSYLGLSTGFTCREHTKEEKRENYAMDITYVTNNEIGFDYLRDNMAFRIEDRVLRGLPSVIIDEVDSILVDEARTPLIISGQEKPTLDVYHQVDALIKDFKEVDDFEINLKDKLATLTDNGINRIEKSLVKGNLFDLENSQMLHAINNALKANYCMEKDIDYVVKEDKVVIVDQFTGRLMPGRHFSDGLHQALEAKEHVTTNVETRTLATITFQNFFRLYEHLSGMTGTAKTEEEEFQKTYGLDVVCIPTNKPMIRKDRTDIVFAKKDDKLNYIVNLIKERHAVGQPLLVGTVAIESSLEIDQKLREAGIKANVLNAKNHELEAGIIENAGKFGAITIATNMAGRGTDIKVEDDVKKIKEMHSDIFDEDVLPNGLFVVGTERHESRRIDDQLRGRSGRQGDNGESIFFISFEDDLMRRFNQSMVSKLMDSNVLDGEPITSKIFTRSIETTQRQVESINFDSRKTILKYDDVLREQREVVYSQRDHILTSDSLYEDILYLIEDNAKRLEQHYLEPSNEASEEDLNNYVKDFLTNEKVNLKIDDQIAKNIVKLCKKELKSKKDDMTDEEFMFFLQTVNLKIFDEHWIVHIDDMQILRQSIGLRGYGQIDPLHEYQREGRRMFEIMISNVEQQILKYLLKGKLMSKSQRQTAMNKLAQEHDKIVSETHNIIPREEKVGRNDMCPCGSGKKYKHCHGK
ncbi:MAG: preprotein translocase subunit SecA, partial [Mycoplasmatales bacterium]